MAKRDDDPNRLVRQSAGRYVSADGRFTVESGESGTWYVADAERHDELGLPLLRGPFPTLAAAREWVREARESGGDTGETVGQPSERPSASAEGPSAGTSAAGRPASEGETPTAERAEETEQQERPTSPRRRAGRAGDAARRAGRSSRRGSEPAAPKTWLDSLTPDRRATAERLMTALDAVGVTDAERLVRRELERDEPAVAETLLSRRVAVDAVEPWTQSPAWILAARSGRGPLRDHAATIKALLDAGIDRTALAELARAIARRAAELTLGAIDSGGFDPTVGRAPRGWRLVETDEAGEPTGRKLAARD